MHTSNFPVNNSRKNSHFNFLKLNPNKKAKTTKKIKTTKTPQTAKNTKATNIVKTPEITQTIKKTKTTNPTRITSPKSTRSGQFTKTCKRPCLNHTHSVKSPLKTPVFCKKPPKCRSKLQNFHKYLSKPLLKKLKQIIILIKCC